MPSQEELDKESGRSSLRSETIIRSGGKRGMRIFSGGAKLNQSSTEWGGKVNGAVFDVSTNTYSPDLDNQQGLDDDTNKRGKDDYEPPPSQEGGGGGGGLPAFPGDMPNVPDFKGILAWSATEGDALWMQGDNDAQDDEGEPLPQVMIYDPTSGTQNFSLLGAQLLDVIMCQNGDPVEGRIFFAESLS